MALGVGSRDDNWNSEPHWDRPISAKQWMANSPAGVGSCPVYSNLDCGDGTFAIRSSRSRIRDYDGLASRVSGTIVHAGPGSRVHQTVRFRRSLLDLIPRRILGTCDLTTDDGSDFPSSSNRDRSERHPCS